MTHTHTYLVCFTTDFDREDKILIALPATRGGNWNVPEVNFHNIQTGAILPPFVRTGHVGRKNVIVWFVTKIIFVQDSVEFVPFVDKPVEM